MINILKISPLITFPACFLLSGSLLLFPLSLRCPAIRCFYVELSSCWASNAMQCSVFVTIIFYKLYCFSFLIMCACVVRGMHVCVQVLGGGLGWSFEVVLTGVGGGNHTWVLLTVDPSLQSFIVVFFSVVFFLFQMVSVLPWLVFPLVFPFLVQVSITILGQQLTKVDFFLKKCVSLVSFPNVSLCLWEDIYYATQNTGPVFLLHAAYIQRVSFLLWWL